MLPPSKLFGTMLRRAVVADGCIIHADRIERAVIGIRSRIGEGTVIENAILMGSDYYQHIQELQQDEVPLGIGSNCHISNAIVDKNCRVGNGVVIRGDDSLPDTETEHYCIRDGIIVLRKGALIPSGSRIGLVES